MNTALKTLRVEEAPNGDELEALLRDLGQSYAVPEIEDDGSGPSVRLTLSGERPIDLTNAPAGKVVHIRLQASPGTQTVMLTGLGPDSVLSLSIPEWQSNQAIRLLTVKDCRGQIRLGSLVRGVRLVCAEPRTEDEHVDEVAVQEARSVVLLADAAITVDEPLSDTVLILRGGTVWVGSAIDELAIVEGGTIELDKHNSGPIETLTVGADAMLTLGPDSPLIETIRGAAPDDPNRQRQPLLQIEPRPRLNDRGGAEEISVDTIENVDIAEKSRPAALRRVKTIFNVEVRGGVRLNLQEHATASQTAFVPDPEVSSLTPMLSAATGAFLLDVSETVDLGLAPGIHISASSSGLSIGIHPLIDGKEDPWPGATMTDVRLPTRLAGRRMLDRLQGAYQLTPDVSGLPGRDQTLIARLARFLHLSRRDQTDYKTGPDAQRRLAEDAEFVRELASLCREKGTPGSVATRITWCSYRLRNIKARGVERAALSVYRLLGYGERPLPAFLLWATLSIALAGPVLIAKGGHPEWCCFGRLFREAGRLALGPLAGLIRGGNLSGGDLAEIAARTATAIPLITGALALRNYVKSER